MPPEEINFQTFFAAKIKDSGISLKKLSEMTGIAPNHLENMVHGKFNDLPSAPYLRGYVARLGKALGFDADLWWDKIKKEGFVKDSRASSNDAMPRNRFVQRSPQRFIWAGAIGLIVVLYLAFQLPIIFSGPSITIIFPTQDPYSTPSSTLTITGTVSGANSLSLNGDNIVIAKNGSWEKSVLLQDGLNSFTITAKKLLGGETSILKQVLYQAGQAGPGTGGLGGSGGGVTSSSSSSVVTTTVFQAPGVTGTPARSHK